MADNDIHNFDKLIPRKREQNNTLDKFANYLKVKESSIESPSYLYRFLNNTHIMQRYERDEDIDFSDLKQEDINILLEEIEDSKYSNKEYSESTKEKYRSTVKKLLQWQEKDPENYLPENYKIYRRDNFDNLTPADKLPDPEELTHVFREIKKQSNDKTRMRNLAFYTALWETGARFGELIRVEKSDIEIRDRTVELPVQGNKDSKDRGVDCYFSAPILKRFIENHPTPDSKYLFTKIHRNKGERSEYRHFTSMIKSVYKSLEEREDIEFDVEYDNQPNHVLRKSMKTWFDNMDLIDPSDLDVRTGHVQGSEQNRIYKRKSDDDANKAYRQSVGVEETDDRDWKAFIEPKKCSGCGQVNCWFQPSCFSCGGVLDENAYPDDVDVSKSIDAADDELGELQKRIQELEDKV